jgi:hypothetical protein
VAHNYDGVLFHQRTTPEAYRMVMAAIGDHERYHEALCNVAPADVYYGRNQEIKARRELTRKKTMRLRRAHNCSLRLV